MSPRRAGLLAWGTFALTVGCMAVAILVGVLGVRAGVGTLAPLDVVWATSWLGLPLVGAAVASRRPENPVGWLTCSFGLPVALILLADEYARYATVVRPGLPAATLALWLSSLDFYLPRLIGVFAFLLFPDGRLPSRRWRPVAWAAVAAGCGGTLASAFGPLGRGDLPAENPLLVPGLAGLCEWVQRVAGSALLLLLPLALLSVVLRMRAASGVERQQVKLLVYGLGFLLAVLLTLFLVDDVAEVRLPDAVTTLAFVVGILAPPAGMGVAILRYRLYDIDRVVNRTLVYATLTAGLGAVDLTGVALLQPLVRPVTGGSDLAVVGSTVAVAALFAPLRRRVQSFVDRRFYRRRYDAARTLEAFGRRLRDEVDLATLRAELRGAVTETMQPAHASVWLREEGRTA